MSQNTLSLFSGAGGAVEGFKQAGHTIVGAVDVDENCIETLEENNVDIPVISEDLAGVNPEKFASKYELYPSDVDVVVGGPPCQGFSLSGKRELDDERNELVNNFLDYVEFYNPTTVLMENVVGILSMADGKVKEYVVERMEKMGYETTVSIHDASEYGVPQERERVIFIGSESGISIEMEQEQQTVADALRKVDESHPNHNVRGHSERVTELIADTEFGETVYDSFNKNIRLDPRKPAPTMVTSGWQFAHPYEDRALTVHERALIQSFPREYVFKGGVVAGRSQTGNALPPLLARKIAENL